MDEVITEEHSLLSPAPRMRTISECSNFSAVKNSFLCHKICPSFLSNLSAKERLIIFVLCLITLFESICFSVMAPFFPTEASLKGVSTTIIGAIFGMFELIIFFAAPLIGMNLGKLGINFTYLSGLLVSGCCSILFGFLKWCPSGTIFIVMCFATRGIEAIAASAYITSSLAIIANTVPSQISLVIGFIETFNGLGMMAGPPIGGLLYKIGGFSLPFWTLGGILVFFGVISFKLMPTLDKNVKSFTGSRFTLLKHPYSLALCFCIITGASSIAFLDPTLAPQLKTFNLSAEYVGLVFLIYPAVYAITAPLWGWICDVKNQPNCLIICGCFLYSASYLFLGPAPFLNIPLKLWSFSVSLGFGGLFVGCMLIPIFSAMMQIALQSGLPEDINTFGLVSGLFNSCFSFGAFLGPTAGSAIKEKIGFAWSCFVIAAFMSTSGAVLVVYKSIQTYLSRASVRFTDISDNPKQHEVKRLSP